ncbi:MAG: GNAT family N-acetyltransferase [Rhodobacteraceae bacterium]|nr:GNAT family N-acetyltransferase [Paracoccaceae bacterium]
MNSCPEVRHKQGWDSLFGEDGPPLQQSWSYGAAMARLGVAVTRRLAAGSPAQVLERRFGPLRLSLLSRWRSSMPGLREVARQHPLLAVTPEGAGIPGLPLWPGREEAVLDIARHPAALRASLHGKWRNRLRRGEGNGLTIRLCTPEVRDVRMLLSLEAQQQSARGYRTLPPAFVFAWLAVSPADALLALALQNGQTIAAMLFLRHGAGATYHCGWSGEQGRATHAHNVLLWRSFLALRDSGVTRLNLGVLTPRKAEGLVRFKLGTGARPCVLGTTVLVTPVPRRGCPA